MLLLQHKNIANEAEKDTESVFYLAVCDICGKMKNKYSILLRGIFDLCTKMSNSFSGESRCEKEVEKHTGKTNAVFGMQYKDSHI